MTSGELFSSPVVYVDRLFVAQAQGPEAFRVGARNGHKWCHMWSDDVKALHVMALRIGLRLEWFQDKPGFPHYDLAPSRRARAIEFGAVEKDLREWLKDNLLKVYRQDLKREHLGKAFHSITLEDFQESVQVEAARKLRVFFWDEQAEMDKFLKGGR